MDFIYINEDSINRLLKCPICSKPFIDPVITRDEDRFCRLCIIQKSTIDNPSDDNQQSSFIENLVPVKEQILLDMLDNLLIKCPDCEEMNLRRGDFQQHLIAECPKRIILCKASDLKCPWNGFYDEYSEHINHCIFELLRPILSESLLYRKELEEYRIGSHEQKNEILELKKQLEQYENRYDKLQKGFKAFLELNIQQKIRSEKLQNDIENVREEFREAKQLENQIEQIKEHNQQISNLLQQFQQSKNDLANEIQQGDFEMKKIQESNSNFDRQIKQLQKQDQHRTLEALRIRQLSEQHEVQIHLLARKKTVVPKSIICSDSKTEELIEIFKSNSEINLDGKHFDNHDMELICKTAITDKQCRKLRLESNEISAKSVTILADTLYNNTTLVQLHLSNNSISDMGVHALAQVLSIKNSTLEWLEIHSNNITDEGAEYLAEMLKTNKTLIVLGLNFNQISDQGVRFLTTAISCYNDTIQWLHLASNKFITDASLDNLIEMLSCNRSLQGLWLNDCSLTTDAITKLKQAVKSKKDFTLEI